MPNSSSFGTPASELPDGSWPIFDELSLKRAISDYGRLVAHSRENPEDVICERIPKIASHICKRAIALDLREQLTAGLVEFGMQLMVADRVDHIALLAEEMAQLARDASADAG